MAIMAQCQCQSDKFWNLWRHSHQFTQHYFFPLVLCQDCLDHQMCGLQAWGQMVIQPIGVIWGVVICESGLKIWATHVLSDMVIVNIFYKPNW